MAVLTKDSKVLKLGVPVLIGSITVNGDQLQFTLPVETLKYRGALMIHAVPNGTLTAFTANVRASLDGGVTFNNIPNGAAVDLATNRISRADVSGLGGVPMELQTASLTFGTATKVDIYLSVG